MLFGPPRTPTSLVAPLTQSLNVRISDLHGMESPTVASLVMRLETCASRLLNAIVNIENWVEEECLVRGFETTQPARFV